MSCLSRIPLLIQFASGTTLCREGELPQGLPIVRNGPPGTFVLFPEGFRVSLPTDQIVHSEERDTGVMVGFGGMTFVGQSAQTLVFHRDREMHPEEQLSPERSRTMLLEQRWVVSIVAEGARVWTSEHGKLSG